MRLLAFAILLAIVYSWDEIVDFLLKTTKLFSGQKIYATSSNYINDEQVTTILLLFAIPLSLISFLSWDYALEAKLMALAIQLLLMGLLATGGRKFWRRIRDNEDYTGWEKLGLAAYALSGLASPIMHLYSGRAKSSSEALGKFAMYLSLPAIAGLLIAQISERDMLTGEILPNINSLIVVMTGGLFIIITINFLERYFRLYRFHLLNYMRIILGILLLFIISEGLI
ncbi:MAG TPA: hypothetical protein VD998_03170 [Verrucomicrobiae bacterium]|nr:hypothetical protein [Verrucomicrobiae bacterium]